MAAFAPSATTQGDGSAPDEHGRVSPHARGAGSAQSFLSGQPDVEALDALADGRSLLSIDGLVAGYGPMEILHGVSLRVAAGQSLCLVGPNGAGKSTVLHSIYGFTDIRSGTIAIAGKDITKLSPTQKLERARIAYVLQDSAVFPDMSVEENLVMGGFLMQRPAEARAAAERILRKYDRLAQRRHHPARVLSGGERRLLEIVRALIMDPAIVLVDEPSIGLEPRSIDMVFEILTELKRNEGKTIVMVEQNARKGLAFADVGYVLVSGRVARIGRGQELLDDPEVGRLFLGG
jgi:branched-chain amino acid transport system ATP-binding protein